MKNENLSELLIEIYTADWCPDCVRELPVIEQLISDLKLDKSQYIYTYFNDKEAYKYDKKNQLLPVSCVPTFIFKVRDKELFRIEEIIEQNLQKTFYESWNHFKSL
jgi:thiol-disulfide isomerase/thioredoxin